MKKKSPVQNSRVSLLVLSCVLLIAGDGILSADEAKPDVTPVISRPGALVFKDDFGKEKIGPEWQSLHGTRWKIIEGTLVRLKSYIEKLKPSKMKLRSKWRNYEQTRQPGIVFLRTLLKMNKESGFLWK